MPLLDSSGFVASIRRYLLSWVRYNLTFIVFIAGVIVVVVRIIGWRIIVTATALTAIIVYILLATVLDWHTPAILIRDYQAARLVIRSRQLPLLECRRSLRVIVHPVPLEEHVCALHSVDVVLWYQHIGVIALNPLLILYINLIHSHSILRSSSRHNIPIWDDLVETCGRYYVQWLVLDRDHMVSVDAIVMIPLPSLIAMRFQSKIQWLMHILLLLLSCILIISILPTEQLIKLFGEVFLGFIIMYNWVWLVFLEVGVEAA